MRGEVDLGAAGFTCAVARGGIEAEATCALSERGIVRQKQPAEKAREKREMNCGTREGPRGVKKETRAEGRYETHTQRE